MKTKINAILENGELFLGPPTYSDALWQQPFTPKDKLSICRDIIKNYIRELLFKFSKKKIKVNEVQKQVQEEYWHFQIVVSQYFIKAFLAKEHALLIHLYEISPYAWGPSAFR